MADSAGRPEIIECEIRLHSARPDGASDKFTDWAQTAVGDPITFQAIAITGNGWWNGPLSPGVEIAASAALDDPYWTVFLPASTGIPIMVGQVGRPLGIGETFTLPPGEQGHWTEGVVFDGAVVTE
jgi:hypothetical protein